MNTAAERKERIKEIIAEAEHVIEVLRLEQPEFEEITWSLTETNEELTQKGYGEFFDFEGAIFAVLENLVDDKLDNLISLVEDFRADLEDLLNEVSESKQDSLADKYVDIDTVESSLDIESCGYETLEDLIEGLNGALELLKGMR